MGQKKLMEGFHEFWETIWTPDRNGNINRQVIFLGGES